MGFEMRARCDRCGDLSAVFTHAQSLRKDVPEAWFMTAASKLLCPKCSTEYAEIQVRHDIDMLEFWDNYTG